MDIERLVRTHVSTSDLDPPQELVQGKCVTRSDLRLLKAHNL